jgi:hypothetical protein
MTTLRERRPAFRSREGWAIGILLAAGAIHECAQHGYMKDRSDPHAREDAVRRAHDEPFSGLSSEQAVAAVRDTLDSIGDTCPDCG